MKIAVFGASVSHQTTNHATGEVTGYAECLRREHAAALGATAIRQITYPGSRLSDGGLLRLADVIAWKPDICLFEPLIEDSRRGANSVTAEKRYVYLSLLEAGILPVTLLLPAPFGKPASQIPHYDQFIALTKQYGLPVIEVTLDGVDARETKFKGVHTLLEGARIYARQIADALQGLPDPQSVVKTALARALASGRPTLTLSHLQPPTGTGGTITSMALKVVSEYPGPVRIRLVQPQSIGTFSPVMDVTLTQDGGTPIVMQKLSVWDEFCHYTRRSYVMLTDTVLKGPGRFSLTLKVSDTPPDYSQCREAVADWPTARYLEPTGGPVLISERPVIASLTQYDTTLA